MPESIGRDEVQTLAREGDAVVVEVLPRAEYDWAHLPGAIHVPLKGWNVERIEARLDREQPVVVYCNDYQ